MKPLPLFLLCSALALLSHASAQKPEISLQKAFPNLVLPDCPSTLAVTPGPGGREVVGLQRGLITVLPTDRDAAKPEVFLDFRERLKEETDFEEGLHGMVFHPDFAKNRRFFLSYSQRGPRRTVISEMCAQPGPDLKADPRTERILMEIPHPLGFHWGGGMVFDPDGYLYVAVGDGGLRDDAYSLSQNPWDLHGKVLRLDVNTRTGSLAYGIPADNPFTAKQEVRPEIWALGFRNPWGLSFDAPTKTLWLADVGQDLWEEINIVTKGGNYGWGEREGPVRMVSRLNYPEKEGPFTEPLHAYSHKDGLSITGGMVYRGSRIPALQGQYLFGDWGHGKIWSLRRNAVTGQSEGATLLFAREGDEPRFNPTVIGADASGEILIFSHYPGDILTLTPNPVLATDETAPEADGTGDIPDPLPDDAVPPEIQEKAEEQSSGA
jgi:glucose/arabinose dehydrogenase